MFEVIWQEFNRSSHIVTKRKAFKTYTAMMKYIAKVVVKDNFWQIIGYDAEEQ